MKTKITEAEAKAMYDDMLDEVAECNFGTLTYSGSYVLEKIDPIAYQCGLNDFIDSISDDYVVEGYE